MRLEAFAKALAEQARSDIATAVSGVSEVFGAHLKALSDEAEALRRENEGLRDTLAAILPRLDAAEAKAGEVADVRERIESISAEVELLSNSTSGGLDAVEAATKALAEDVGAIRKELGHLAERLAEVEAREPIPGPQGERGEKGDPGAPGAPGADGVGLAGALIDRDGQLVVTLTNGETKALGPVVGKDGLDGEPGAPGRNAFELEDFTADVADDGRTIRLAFVRGETRLEHALKLAVPLDRGVWRPDNAYEKGDAVTYAGALWIATGDAPEGAPGTGEGWRLAVKKGRDGRDGKDGVVKAEKRIAFGGVA